MLIPKTWIMNSNLFFGRTFRIFLYLHADSFKAIAHTFEGNLYWVERNS